MRRGLLFLAAMPVLAGLPSWWLALPRQTALSARFTQASDSAVFGTLKQAGSLLLARGGRLRVAYDSGLLIISDGTRLVQYDPDTRTAQGVDLRSALKDFPLLGLLLEPGRLEGLYTVTAGPGDSVRLHPRQAGLPEIQAEGRGGLLREVRWTDPTGARQVLVLQEPKVPRALPDTTFRFTPPPGTRWATPEP